MDEQAVLYNWWMALKALNKDLNKQKKFAETKFIGDINKRRWNAPIITTGSIRRISGTNGAWSFFHWLFYVVYTMWYGFPSCSCSKDGG